MANREHKVYLGDGAYATWDGFGIWITAENGIEVTSRVYLEPSVYSALKRFAESVWKHENGHPTF